MKYNFEPRPSQGTIGSLSEGSPFDEIINRKNTNCIKYDPVSRGRPEDILPMWVADMDFASPPCVIDALVSRARHGIFGYSEPGESYFTAVQNWYKNRFNWNVQKDWLVITAGVVNALFLAVRAFSKPGDGIVIQQPVYYPFGSAALKTERKLLVNELIYKDGAYIIDFEDFENKIKNAKIFILCNPHNPGGRVWKSDELFRMGEICLKHNVLIISDEIHQDIIFAPNKHLVFAGLDEKFAGITVTCTSPSKTFNLASFNHANIFISNEKLRSAFKKEYENCGMSQSGVMGLISCEAAYTGGADWLEELIEYLSLNIDLLDQFLKINIPNIKLVKPEGTYLAWLDCRDLGLSAKDLDDTFTNKVKLWLNDGRMFGSGGSGFQRMNIACPRSTLENALEKLKSVFRGGN